ncbi:MAG: hypothetical protein E7041_05280 [Lentisphaerae bacterium]|nr:hypothetical protein [Lentisphaerota bacterium]
MRDISVQVSKHDKYQLELKFICPMREEKTGGNYSIELYFFLPRNLAVSADNYDSRDFYNDMSEYIRFQTPEVSLAELALGSNEILKHLKSCSPDDVDEYTKALKMFCSIAKSAMRDTAANVLKLEKDQQLAAAGKFMDDIRSLLTNFRKERPDERRCPRSCEMFDLVDEFLSLCSNRYIYRMWNNSAFADDPQFSQHVAAVTGDELTYRDSRGYLSVPRRGADNSEVVYRESALKKAMADILFLKVATRKDGVVIENLLMGLGAAVAMIFVTAISFLWASFLLEELSISFFIVWVIAYIFKDRIKAGMQGYFLRNRSRYSYDFKQDIRDGLGNSIGICREGFHYCSEQDLDDELVKLRDRRMLSRLENASQKDNIMVFRKRIELSGSSCQDIYRDFQVNGVVDILRMSTRHWTYKMDNPFRTIFISDGETISSLKANRDYHVNMILRYGGKKGYKLERYRLILCRDGIRSLEKIVSANSQTIS